MKIVCPSCSAFGFWVLGYFVWGLGSEFYFILSFYFRNRVPFPKYNASYEFLSSYLYSLLKVSRITSEEKK